MTWSFSALEMLAEVHEYINEKSEQAADNYVDGIFNTTLKLEKYPESCSPCRNQKLRESGYRCCLYKSHIIVYDFTNNEVNILAIFHSRRNPSDVKNIIK